VAGLALPLLPGSVAAQVAITPIAVSGAAAPAGGNYSSFNYVTPTISSSGGQVAFIAGLTGGSSGQGIFAGPPGSLQAVALLGTAAPAGGNYSNYFSSHVVNASGQVGFSVDLSGSSAFGIFVGNPGSVQVAALQGTAAPAGGNYSGFIDPELNASGAVAFHSDLAGGSSSQGIFVGSPGSMQAVALTGGPAPGGGTYSGLSYTLGLNASGQVAFEAAVNAGTNSGIFVGVPGSVQAAAMSGNAAPAGGNYNGFTAGPMLNAAGQLAFTSRLTGGSSAGGIFVGAVGALQAAALLGTAAPAGGNYSNFIGVPAFNNLGQIAFSASLSGGSSTSGIFMGAPGAIQAVALQGLPAPAGNGATFSGFNINNAIGLNALGQVAFLGNLTGTGVTGANDLALYVASPGGVVEVVRTGDMIDAGNGSGPHAVRGIHFLSSGGSFSDSGELVYTLIFTDGTSGIFESTIPVPEPLSVLLAAAGLLAAVRCRKRLAKRGGTTPAGSAVALVYPLVDRSGRRSWPVGLLAGMALHLLPGLAAAQVAITPIAVTGAAAPAGGNYSSFIPAAKSSSGQVAFSAYLTGGSSGQGIFAGPPGSLQTVALAGAAAPAGGNYSFLNGPRVNASGQVGFLASLSGSSASGIFVGNPGSLQVAALQGTAAPAGGNYYSLVNAPSFNDSGAVAFYASLTGGSSSGGIFAGTPGSMQAVALNGGPAPGGGTYFGFGNGLALNASGQVAFSANVNSATNWGIFVGAPGSVQAAAMVGNAAPAGGNYNDFYVPRINAAGQVAFSTNLTGGSSSRGIFVGAVGALQAVALQGNAAPAGGNYSDFVPDTLALNHLGQVAFYSSLSGGSSTGGIFAGAPGAIQAVALQGLPAPAGNGATFSGFANNPLGLNALGQVAFRGNLTGTGVTSANDQALYVASPGGVVEVVRKGDMIDVGNGSGLHAVSTIGFFEYGNSFSDSGELVFSLAFTDGTSGIFKSTVPVPEPTSVLLAATGLLAAVRIRKRLKHFRSFPSVDAGDSLTP
jgi:hypothetical protein